MLFAQARLQWLCNLSQKEAEARDFLRNISSNPCVTLFEAACDAFAAC
jgi:hypothetical protein